MLNAQLKDQKNQAKLINVLMSSTQITKILAAFQAASSHIDSLIHRSICPSTCPVHASIFPSSREFVRLWFGPEHGIAGRLHGANSRPTCVFEAALLLQFAVVVMKSSAPCKRLNAMPRVNRSPIVYRPVCVLGINVEKNSMKWSDCDLSNNESHLLGLGER